MNRFEKISSYLGQFVLGGYVIGFVAGPFSESSSVTINETAYESSGILTKAFLGAATIGGSVVATPMLLPVMLFAMKTKEENKK
jgi:hypothetical protein